MSKKTLLLLMLIIIGVSCTDREKKYHQSESMPTYKPDSNALKLNNKAARLMGNVSSFNGDSLNNLLYDSAIIYLNQAIEVDSLYLLAYTNKARALQRKGSLEQSLKVLRKVEAMKPDLAEVIMGQGFLLEKMGKIDLASKKYSQALETYEKRLSDENRRIKTQSDIAFLYLFLEDRNKAMDEIRNLILENPGSNELKAIEESIKNFDRKKFIEEY